MNKIIFASLLLIITSCKKEENLNSNNTIKESDLNLDSINIDTSNIKNNVKKDKSNNVKDEILGEWDFKNNDSEHSYSFKIEKIKELYTAEFCFIKGKDGDEIDCPEDKFTGVLNKDGILEVEFISDFTDDSIKCKLYLIDNKTLKLESLSDVGTSFFEKTMIFLKK